MNKAGVIYILTNPSSHNMSRSATLTTWNRG